MGLNFIEYDEYITKIRMCRTDLTPEELKKEIDNLMHSNSKIPGEINWHQVCLEKAMKGDPMPWEEVSFLRHYQRQHLESSFTRVGTAISGRLRKFGMWFFQQLLRCFPEKCILTTDRQGTEWFVFFKRFRGRIYNLRLFSPISSHPNCRCVTIPID